MEIFIMWIIFSVLVGFAGSSRTLGFVGAFLLSLFLSPLVGIIAVALSSRKKTQAEYRMLADQIASSSKPQTMNDWDKEKARKYDLSVELEKLRSEGHISEEIYHKRIKELYRIENEPVHIATTPTVTATTTPPVTKYVPPPAKQTSNVILLGAGGAVLLFFGIMIFTGVNKSNYTMETQVDPAPQQTSVTSVAEDRDIPGLMPVDVYLNYTDMGFTIEKSLGGEFGNSWNCTMETVGCTYRVDTFGETASTVMSVRATAQGSITKEAIEFISYAATIPYDGSNPARAKQWVIDNIKKGGEIVIGDVKFTLRAPSDFVRILTIEKF